MALLKPAKSPEFAGPEYEPGISGVPPRVSVSERRYQHGACVRRHMQPVGHQRQRAEQTAADDLNHHHHAAQGDDTPGLALVLFVPGAEEDVTMAAEDGGIANGFHTGAYLK